MPYFVSVFNILRCTIDPNCPWNLTAKILIALFSLYYITNYSGFSDITQCTVLGRPIESSHFLFFQITQSILVSDFPISVWTKLIFCRIPKRGHFTYVCHLNLPYRELYLSHFVLRWTEYSQTLPLPNIFFCWCFYQFLTQLIWTGRVISWLGMQCAFSLSCCFSPFLMLDFLNFNFSEFLTWFIWAGRVMSWERVQCPLSRYFLSSSSTSAKVAQL